MKLKRQLGRLMALYWQLAARKSLLLFALVFLPHLFYNGCAPYHARLCRELEAALEPGGRLLGALPREHGKTTLGTVAAGLREIALGGKRNILLVAANQREAQAKLRLIVHELESNARLKQAFNKHVQPARDKWGRNVAYADGEIVLAGGLRVLTLGFGGKVRGQLAGGRRLDLVLLDDPEDDTLAQSPLRRACLCRWFDRALLNALDVQTGSLIWLGTLLHHDSVLAQLLKQHGAANSSAACDAASAPGASWRTLCLPALDEAGEPLWPQRWSRAALAARREEIGDLAFAQEYQNQPVSLCTQIFKPGDFLSYDPAQLSYAEGRWQLAEGAAARELTVAIGVDPAIRLSEQADYFAACVIGVAAAEPDGKPQVYILDLLRERASFAEQLTALSTLAGRWLPQVIGIEATAYQEALAQAAFDSGLPVKPLSSNHPKAVRIAAASTHSAGGRVYLPLGASWAADFRAEAESYPAGRHDDQLDAFARALEAGLPLLSRSAEVLAAEKQREQLRGF